ncbi:MAG: Ldh family oxidoreductase, partial [Candidatus Hodarchaeales archaeon]
KAISGTILRQLRNSRKAPGHDRIYTAGEKEYFLEQKHMKLGIPVMPSIILDLEFLQEQLQIKGYSF